MANAPPCKNRTKFSPTSGPRAYKPGCRTLSCVSKFTATGFRLQSIGIPGCNPILCSILLRNDRLGCEPMEITTLEICSEKYKKMK